MHIAQSISIVNGYFVIFIISVVKPIQFFWVEKRAAEQAG